MKSGILAGVVLLAATGAAAAPPAQDAAPAQTTAGTAGAAPEPQEEKKICRVERATGSLTRRNRICLTATQWREVYDRTRRGVGELQGSASGGKQCVADASGGCM